MKMQLTAACCALLVALAAAEPQTVYVKRIPSEVEKSLADGTWAAKRAERLRISKDADQQNETDQYNTFYLGQVDIGTPAQTFTVVLDTGSSDLWVAGPDYFLNDKKKFNPNASSTFKDLGGHWSIQYGSGSAQGTKGQDVVGFTSTSYSFPTQIFGLAKTGQAGQPIDGICGMSYPSISSIKTPDPWYNIIKNGNNPPASPWFTVWLEELSGVPSGQIGGAFTFGGNDNAHCSASCTWVALSHELWYELQVDSIGAGSYASPSQSAISDTGTSFLIGPTQEINSIGGALGAKFSFSEGLYSISCDATTLSTTIDVKINGNTYSIQPKNYIYEAAPRQCYVAMQGAALGNPQWILGDTFIRQYCNMYDMVNNRIGLCMATM